ncbi:serine endopeptidase [Diaporthe helianthi]|uniref:Serine endopeptidase n=1 Tax=Diaporthe helianthi TaxID=158607 RepID=A0A2P5HTU5_DIAHE|nr:serine endopeptidase [Diaporthe helianthi]
MVHIHSFYLLGAVNFVHGVVAQEFPASQPLSRLANGFIVEYADGPESQSVDVVQKVALQVSDATGVHVSHKMDLRSSIFNGASFRITKEPQNNAAEGLKSSDELLEAALLQMPAIAAVYPNTVRYLQAPVDLEAFGRAGSEEYLRSVGKRQTGNGSDETQLYFGPDGTPLVNPHAMTGVDRLHAEGATGEGIKIAIIDSGIDAFHEALGGGFGPGFKVAGGYDFVGDRPNNDVSPPVPDDSPQTVCANHGTATSAIAAGLPYKFGFVGVAPNATIYHYKVFPCSGGVSTDVGVNASLAAYEEGVDVINASIGGQGGWGMDLWGVIASRIMAGGTTYIISGGNDGARGSFIANSLSSTQGVPSIGSIDNAYSPTLVADGSYSVNEGEAVPIEYTPGFPANWTSPLEIINLQVNGCTPYPNMTYKPNQVILLQRPYAGTPLSTCNQNEQVQAAGIRNILFYNYFDDVATRPLPLVTTEGFPFEWLDGVGYIDNALGTKLAGLLSSGNKITLDLPWKPDNDTRVPRLMKNNISGGFMSNYSTWGPTYEAKIGTTFSAPGANVLTAGGRIYGGLVIASGTSFSAPYVAGVAALIKQAHPGITPDEIINRLATTAKPVKMQSNQRQTQDYLAPAFQQGGGMIDAYAALKTTTTLNVSDLAFNDTAYSQPQSFEIRNGGADSVTFELVHNPGPTLYTFSPGSIRVTAFSNDSAFSANVLPDAHAELSFSQSSATVEAGGTAAFTVRVTPPAGLEASRLPLYSGFITIKGSNGDNLSLAYGGVASELRNVPVLDTTPGQERTVLIANTTEGDVRPGVDGDDLTSTFTIPRVTGNITTSTALTNLTLPGYRVNPVFGSLRLSVSLLQDAKNLGLISTVDKVQPYFVRDDPVSHYFYGRMADDSFVQDSGTYRFQVRMLRVTGNPDVEADWDQVVTEPFTLVFSDDVAANTSAVASRERRRRSPAAAFLGGR